MADLSSIVGDEMRLDWLADRVVELPRGDRWQALARNALREDFTGAHRAILAAILDTLDAGLEPADAYAKWTDAHPEIERVLVLLREIETHGVFDLAVLSVALRELRNLVSL